ncbi:MAG: MTH1187 family thiamine-binding protein [Archaeoglobaceae archaeon]
MIVEISVVPLGYRSLSSFVAEVLKELEVASLKYELNPMGTVLELESFEELGKLLERIESKLRELGSERNYYVVKVDTKSGAMEDKVRSVKEKLK